MSANTKSSGAGEAAEPKGGKKKLLVVVALVVALAGAAYFFVLKPAPSEAKPAPTPGEVVALEAIQVNLAGGHYLKIGIALQLTAEAHEADGSKALDATIDLFTGRSMGELASAKHREELKKELEKELKHLYHHEVMGVYFTDFVTQ